ncbi:hypothetical protein ALC62_09514, partial [Cyphomyrmex costatus]
TPFMLYNNDNTSVHFAKISTKSKYYPLCILEAFHRYPSGFNVIFLSCRNILQQRSRGCTEGLHGSDRRPHQDGSVTFMILVQRLRSMIRGEITLGSNHFSVPGPQGQMGRGGVAKSLAKP